MKFSLAAILLFISVFSCKSKDPEFSNAFQKNPNALAVSDYSNIFSTSENLVLATKLVDYEALTTRQIAIVTVDSISPYSSIQDYASDLGKYWGVGQKNLDNGLVIVFSKPLSKIAIASGYGTEKILTDEICKRIIDSVMIPKFKEKSYYEGINNGIDSLIQRWNKDI
ncbi:TPM domain-containing protein [Aequorivita sp. Q41]|uniref:TPM domain-containing protein n=1 Tax=Aequorivita sp. Q41 TaxID=3153300 RepID=UPI003242F8D6